MASKFNLGSVAFLDLLTCGLGGVLLLFFIVVAVRNTDSGQDMTDSSARGNSNEVLVIQLSVPLDASLFAQEDHKFYWEKDGLEIEQPKTVDISCGESFMVVYAIGQQPSGTRLMVTGLNTGSQIQGMVFDRFGSRNLNVKDPSESFCLYQFASRSSGELR